MQRAVSAGRLSTNRGMRPPRHVSMALVHTGSFEVQSQIPIFANPNRRRPKFRQNANWSKYLSVARLSRMSDTVQETRPATKIPSGIVIRSRCANLFESVSTNHRKQTCSSPNQPRTRTPPPASKGQSFVEAGVNKRALRDTSRFETGTGNDNREEVGKKIRVFSHFTS